ADRRPGTARVRLLVSILRISPSAHRPCMLAADSPASVGFCLPARAARAPRPRTPWPELASYSPARAPLLGHLFRQKLRGHPDERLKSHSDDRIGSESITRPAMR